MANLSPECRAWFASLEPDIKTKIGEGKAQEIFDSLKIFENEVSWEDIRSKKLDRLNEIRTEKRVMHLSKGKPTKEEINSFKAMERAFNTLGKIANELNPRTVADIAQTADKKAEEAKKDEQKAWSAYKKLGMLETEEEKAARLAREQEKAAEALGNAMHTFEREAGIKDSGRPLKGKSTRDSLKAAGSLLSNEYFDLVLMLVGIVGGVFLTFSYSWIIGIPLVIGGIIVSLLPGGDGRSIFSKLFDSVLKPAGSITMGGGVRTVFIFIAGVLIVSVTTSFMAITDLGFDPLQFAIVAFTNTVLLAYLWTGVLKKGPTEEVMIRAPATGAGPAEPKEHVEVRAGKVSAKSAQEDVTIRAQKTSAEMTNVKKSIEEEERELEEEKIKLRNARQKLEEKQREIDRQEQHIERKNE